jgi:hypothetical protein
MTSGRREFIRKALTGLLALLGLGFLLPSAALFAPVKGRDKALVFRAHPEDELPRPA